MIRVVHVVPNVRMVLVKRKVREVYMIQVEFEILVVTKVSIGMHLLNGNAGTRGFLGR